MKIEKKQIEKKQIEKKQEEGCLTVRPGNWPDPTGVADILAIQ